MRLRIAFLGNDPWSVPSLEAIATDPELYVALVITNPPKPAGRGASMTPTAVAAAARARDLPLREVAGVRDGAGAAALAAARPDVVVVVAYGELLDEAALTLAPHGAINLHFSLLPRWRGAAPVQRALIAGDAVTGITIMRMDRGLDTGPILEQADEPIRPDDDAGTLGGRLAQLGGAALVGVLRMLPSGDVVGRPQNNRLAIAAPRIVATERLIDWSMPAEEIVRWVRGLAPDPGATTRFRGQPLKILEAAVDVKGGGIDSGRVLTADDGGVVVGAGDGSVRLRRVAPAGRARMDAAAWARGARFTDGERLG